MANYFDLFDDDVGAGESELARVAPTGMPRFDTGGLNYFDELERQEQERARQMSVPQRTGEAMRSALDDTEKARAMPPPGTPVTAALRAIGKAAPVVKESVLRGETWRDAWQAMKGSMIAAGGGLVEQIGGLRDALAERISGGEGGEDARLVADLATGGLTKKLSELKGRGRQAIEIGSEMMAEGQEPTDPWLAQRISGAAGSIVPTAAAIGVGMATRNEPLALSMFGGWASGQSYGQIDAYDRQQQALGHAPMRESDKQAYAALNGAGEALSEKLPTEVVLKAGLPFLKRAFAFLTGEVPGELASQYLSQKLDEKYANAKPLTPEQGTQMALDVVAETLLLGGPTLLLSHGAEGGASPLEEDIEQLRKDLAETRRSEKWRKGPQKRRSGRGQGAVGVPPPGGGPGAAGVPPPGGGPGGPAEPAAPAALTETMPAGEAAGQAAPAEPAAPAAPTETMPAGEPQVGAAPTEDRSEATERPVAPSAAQVTPEQGEALKAVAAGAATPEQAALLENTGWMTRSETNAPRLLPEGRRRLAEIKAAKPSAAPDTAEIDAVAHAAATSPTNRFGRKMEESAKGVVQGTPEEFKGGLDLADQTKPAVPVVAEEDEAASRPVDPADRFPQFSEDTETAERLDDPRVAQELRRMATQAGWAEVGGRIIRKSEDFNSPDYNVVSRTKWIPKEPWFQELGTRLPQNADYPEVIERALSGGKLNARERRVIAGMAEAADRAVHGDAEQVAADYQALSEAAREIRGSLTGDDIEAYHDFLIAEERAADEWFERERQSAQADEYESVTGKAGREDVRAVASAAGEEAQAVPRRRTRESGEAPFELTSEPSTAQRLADKAREREPTPEQREKADEEAKDFRLTGSERPSDVGMAAGQIDFVGNSMRRRVRRAAVTKPARRETSQADADAFADEIKRRYGLSELSVQVTPRGTLELESIVVPKRDRNAGRGSAAMKALTEFADDRGLEIELQTAQRDMRAGSWGTTSRRRLRKFYRRFGFTLNQGANKRAELSLYTDMYRVPRGRRPLMRRTRDEITRTPAFKRWFGASKALDDDGKPLVLYHGTSEDFEEFYGGPTFPIWLTPDRDVAGQYATRAAVQNKAEREEEDERELDEVPLEELEAQAREGLGQSIYPVYARMLKPLDLSDLGESPSPTRLFEKLQGLGIFGADETADDAIDFLSNPDAPLWKVLDEWDVPRDAQRQGYDSIIISDIGPDGNTHLAYAIFDPSQVKSAVGNTGEFSTESPSLVRRVRAAGSIYSDGFKQWFGDWRRAHALRHLTVFPEVPVVLPAETDLATPDLWKQTTEFYRLNIQGTSVVTETGDTVRFTAVGLKKARFHGADRRIAQTLQAIQPLMKSAVLLEERAPQGGDTEAVKGYNVYGVKVRLNGETQFVKIVTRRSQNEEIYYDHDVTSQKELDSGRPVPGSLAAWLRDAKGTRASMVVDTRGKPLRLYHGTERLDRVDRFRAGRATSGPMPFFTDDPDVASGYAINKRDTSLDDRGYDQWFTVAVPGVTTRQPLTFTWYTMTDEQRNAFNDAMRRIGYDEDGTKIQDNGKGGGLSPDTYDWALREARGNGLKAAIELWLNSGTLFRNEVDFLKVLKLAGIDTRKVQFVDVNRGQPGVIPVYLNLRNPFYTSNVDEEFVERMQKAANRARWRPGRVGVDPWDARAMKPQAWVNELRADLENGTTYAWTSIPPFVVRELKRLGYDGISDTGGKFTDLGHNVWIPFSPDQVKSAVGARFMRRGFMGHFRRDQSDNILNRPEIQQRIKALNTIRRLKQGYFGPNIEIYGSLRDLPRDLARQAEADGIPINKIGGFYWNGTIYLNYLNEAGVFDEADLTESFFHELVGHHGFNVLLSDQEWQEIVDGIWRDMPDRVRLEAENAELDITNPLHRRLAAEEVVARMAGEMLAGHKLTKLEQNVWQRVVAAIRRLLDAMGIVKYYDDRRIAGIIRRAQDLLREPGHEAARRIAGRALYKKRKGIYSSRLMDFLESDMAPNVASATEWKQLLASHSGKSFPKAELEWSQLESLLSSDGPTWSDALGDTLRNWYGRSQNTSGKEGDHRFSDPHVLAEKWGAPPEVRKIIDELDRVTSIEHGKSLVGLLSATEESIASEAGNLATRMWRSRTTVEVTPELMDRFYEAYRAGRTQDDIFTYRTSAAADLMRSNSDEKVELLTELLGENPELFLHSQGVERAKTEGYRFLTPSDFSRAGWGRFVYAPVFSERAEKRIRSAWDRRHKALNDDVIAHYSATGEIAGVQVRADYYPDGEMWELTFPSAPTMFTEQGLSKAVGTPDVSATHDVVASDIIASLRSTLTKLRDAIRNSERPLTELIDRETTDSVLQAIELGGKQGRALAIRMSQLPREVLLDRAYDAFPDIEIRPSGPATLSGEMNEEFDGLLEDDLDEIERKLREALAENQKEYETTDAEMEAHVEQYIADLWPEYVPDAYTAIIDEDDADAVQEVAARLKQEHVTEEAWRHFQETEELPRSASDFTSAGVKMLEDVESIQDQAKELAREVAYRDPPNLYHRDSEAEVYGFYIDREITEESDSGTEWVHVKVSMSWDLRRALELPEGATREWQANFEDAREADEWAAETILRARDRLRLLVGTSTEGQSEIGYHDKGDAEALLTLERPQYAEYRLNRGAGRPLYGERLFGWRNAPASADFPRYRGGHFSDIPEVPNLLAFTRFEILKIPDGRDILWIDETQSDYIKQLIDAMRDYVAAKEKEARALADVRDYINSPLLAEAMGPLLRAELSPEGFRSYVEIAAQFDNQDWHYLREYLISRLRSLEMVPADIESSESWFRAFVRQQAKVSLREGDVDPKVISLFDWTAFKDHLATHFSRKRLWMNTVSDEILLKLIRHESGSVAELPPVYALLRAFATVYSSDAAGGLESEKEEAARVMPRAQAVRLASLREPSTSDEDLHRKFQRVQEWKLDADHYNDVRNRYENADGDERAQLEPRVNEVTKQFYDKWYRDAGESMRDIYPDPPSSVFYDALDVYYDPHANVWAPQALMDRLERRTREMHGSMRIVLQLGVRRAEKPPPYPPMKRYVPMLFAWAVDFAAKHNLAGVGMSMGSMHGKRWRSTTGKYQNVAVSGAVFGRRDIPALTNEVIAPGRFWLDTILLEANPNLTLDHEFIGNDDYFGTRDEINTNLNKHGGLVRLQWSFTRKPSDASVGKQMVTLRSRIAGWVGEHAAAALNDKITDAYKRALRLRGERAVGVLKGEDILADPDVWDNTPAELDAIKKAMARATPNEGRVNLLRENLAKAEKDPKRAKQVAGMRAALARAEAELTNAAATPLYYVVDYLKRGPKKGRVHTIGYTSKDEADSKIPGVVEKLAQVSDFDDASDMLHGVDVAVGGNVPVIWAPTAEHDKSLTIHYGNMENYNNIGLRDIDRFLRQYDAKMTRDAAIVMDGLTRESAVQSGLVPIPIGEERPPEEGVRLNEEVWSRLEVRQALMRPMSPVTGEALLARYERIVDEHPEVAGQRPDVEPKKFYLLVMYGSYQGEPIGFIDTRHGHDSPELAEAEKPRFLLDTVLPTVRTMDVGQQTWLLGRTGIDPTSWPTESVRSAFWSQPVHMMGRLVLFDDAPKLKKASLDDEGFPLVMHTRWRRRAAALGAQATGSPTFDLPEPSRWSALWAQLVYYAQNRFIDLFRTQKAVAAWRRGVGISDAEDAYLKQTLFPGRAEARIEDYEKQFVDPLVQLIKRSGYDWGQVEQFLYARHAPEANARIRFITQNDPRYSSGMSDAEAAAVMSDLARAGDIRKLYEIGAFVDRMTKWARDTMVAEGLQTPETIASWEATYKYYVPLKGWAGEPDAGVMARKGKGFDTGGKFVKARTGRTTLAGDLLANIVAEAHSTIILAEKAKVGRALYDFVTNTPAPDLWTVNEVEYTRYLDPVTGLVRSGVNPSYKLADHVVRVKIGGKDYHITFNPERPEMLRLAAAMKNLSAAEMGKLLGFLHGINRYLSAINTSLNPEFLVTNALRDLQTAMVNLTSEERGDIRLKILRDWRKAWWAVRRGEQGKSGEWAAEWDEFKHLGGKVGWLQAYDSPADLSRELQRKLGPDGYVAWTGEQLRAVGNVIERENVAVENAVRLATFVHLKGAGLSPERAAAAAKNLTVNFNQRGAAGVVLNSLYLFYNASVQGTARLYQTAKSRKGRIVLGGMVAAAIAMDILNRMIGGDDDDKEPLYDKIPEYEKSRNLIVMLPEELRWKRDDGSAVSYLKVPMPYGFNAVYYTGTVLGKYVDYGMIGNRRRLNFGGDAAEVMSAYLGAFSPIGDATSLSQFLLPTLADPFVQLYENKAWYGGKIMPEPSDFDQAPPPDSERYFDTVPVMWRELARELNEITGGTEVTPGKVSISPETFQHFADFMTGGMGRFLTSAADMPIKALDPMEHLATREMAFVRKVVGQIGDRETQETFYGHMSEIAYAKKEIDAIYRMGIATQEGQERLSKVALMYPVALKMVREAFPNYARTSSDEDLDRNIVLRDLKQRATSVGPANAEPRPRLGLRKSITGVLADARGEIKRLERRAGAMPEKERVERIEAQKKIIRDTMIEFNRQWNEVEDATYGERNSGKLYELLSPLISGRSKAEAAKSLTEAGFTSTGQLFASLPAATDRFAREFFEIEAARGAA